MPRVGSPWSSPASATRSDRASSPASPARANAPLIVERAAKHRLPAMYASTEFVGGLASYGVNYPDHYRRAATFADKIFKGAKPADLPVEQPTKLELVVNLRTARALGLTIPRTVLLQVDQVVE